MWPMARKTPVIMAGSAAGSMIRQTVCRCDAPRARLAERNVEGTNLSDTSVERHDDGDHHHGESECTRPSRETIRRADYHGVSKNANDD